VVAPLAARWLRLADSEVDLALGDAATVVHRYRHPAPGSVLFVAERTMLARAYEMTEEYDAGEEIAARLRDGADVVSGVTAWVVTALIADGQGHARRSADALAHAVLRAEAEGIRRPFQRFDSRRMLQLAERQRWLYEERAPAGGSVLADVEDEQGFPPLPAIPDTLSERERDVLRYLPSVLTAHEIATDLNISVNTVKAHMRAIYRKLGAGRRREAVVRARQTGLL
jgi:LuxR family maltose regulon positive regulatory protein